MTLIIKNIRQLLNVRKETILLRKKDLADLPCIENAYLVIEGSEIAEFGEMAGLKYNRTSKDTLDASGRLVFPTWCDSHSHLVFAESREEEFVDKIKGLSYVEINERGGGILNSAHKVSEISEDELFIRSWQRLEEVKKLGTGAIEIKSGYGLSLEGELKMLRVIKRLKSKSNLCIKSTFLGAHSFPLRYRIDHAGYLELILNQMLPAIAEEGLADYVDVFCEKGFFNISEMENICNAARSTGLKPKLHVNQLNSFGAVESGVRLGALTLDHLEVMDRNDIQVLAHSGSIGTLLPTAAYFLGMKMPPARQLIEAGAAISLASDYNPGSSPSGNMKDRK